MMNKKKFDKTVKKAKKLIKEGPSFKTIIFDNWRGWRFIFDTQEVRDCKNDCQNCNLYNLSKQAGQTNYARLIKASTKDKKIFGPENFLNCKPREKYKKCYINFILKKTKTKLEIQDELNLLIGMKVVYSNEATPEESEYLFKKEVISSVLARCGKTKRKIIKNYLLERNLTSILL